MAPNLENMERMAEDGHPESPVDKASSAQPEHHSNSSPNQSPHHPPPTTSSMVSTISQDDPTTRKSPPLPLLSQSFRESKICVAVDVSSSTYGDILAAEKRSVNNICKLIPRRVRPTIKILPWNHAPGAPVDFDNIDELDSRGGTDPNVFLQDSSCRDLLQDADFWFLMTDGEIDDPLVRKFARSLVEFGLHGKACIISVFGERDMLPGDCDITVGLSVFAVSPHAAFLYHDVNSGKTYILQTKGCFSVLLPPGQHNPALTASTGWDDLPLTAFEDLSRVSVPHSQVVSKDEILLQGDTRVNLSKFLKELPEDEGTISQVLDNEDNMKTIALNAKLRGESDRLRSWLDRVDARLEQQEQSEPIKGDAASGLVAQAMENLFLPEKIPKPSLTPQATVTACRPPSLPDPWVRGPSLLRPNSGHNVCKVPDSGQTTLYRRNSSQLMRRISKSSVETAGENFRGPPIYHRPPIEQQTSTLRIPGFRKSRTKVDYYSCGECTACGAKSPIVTFLLRGSRDQASTPNFPPERSHSIVAFPLAMGNYVETDIVNSLLACERCAISRIGSDVALGRSLFALPLVSFSDNQAAWIETLDQATNGRFQKVDLPLVFLAILYTKYERLLEEGEQCFSMLLQGVKWECNMLLSEVVIQPAHDVQSSQLGVGALHDVLLRIFGDALINRHATNLLEYPLDGFIVANVALSNSRHGYKISGQKRKTVVFLRFLYHLTQNYHDYIAQNEDCVVQAAKSLVLLMDESNKRSSLFRWDSIRKLSVHFKDAAEMRRFLSKNHQYRVSISMKDLSESPFLTGSDVAQFERLGVLSSWIASQAAHATAVFLHHLFRTNNEGGTVQEMFAMIRALEGMEVVLKDPADVSPKQAESMIKLLPPL